MSVYKPFITSDITSSPLKVNKSFSYEGANIISGSGIDRFLGRNLSPLIWSSGSYPTGDINIQDELLIYRSIKELYYSNFIGGDDGAPAGTASFNEDGTITGPAYTPNSYNYLSNTLPANRFFPTGSDEQIGILSIPTNLYGEFIKPGTLTLSYIPNGGSTVINLVDDGEGNVLEGSLKVGDIIYSHGMVILTSDGIPATDGYGYVNYGTAIYGASDASYVADFVAATNISCSFESTITLHEQQLKCTIRENEFNFSLNPTLSSGSSNVGVLYDFATGSFFSPYITTVGLYNNDKELLAVAKLAQPLPISQTTDTTIMINFDF